MLVDFNFQGTSGPLICIIIALYIRNYLIEHAVWWFVVVICNWCAVICDNLWWYAVFLGTLHYHIYQHIHTLNSLLPLDAMRVREITANILCSQWFLQVTNLPPFLKSLYWGFWSNNRMVGIKVACVVSWADGDRWDSAGWVRWSQWYIFSTTATLDIIFSAIQYDTIYLHVLKSWWNDQLSLAHGTETKN